MCLRPLEMYQAQTSIFTGQLSRSDTPNGQTVSSLGALQDARVLQKVESDERPVDHDPSGDVHRWYVLPEARTPPQEPSDRSVERLRK
jgi:hypothetical protein